MVWFLIEAKSIEFCSSVKEGVLPFNRLLWVVKLWFQVYIHKLTICFWHDGFKETVSRSLEYLPVFLCMVGMFKIWRIETSMKGSFKASIRVQLVGAWQGGGADCRQSCEALEHLPGGWQAARPAHHSHILLTHGLQVSLQILAILCTPQRHFHPKTLLVAKELLSTTWTSNWITKKHKSCTINELMMMILYTEHKNKWIGH